MSERHSLGIRRAISMQRRFVPMLLCVILDCHATSIVTVISPHGIVVGVDGKVSQELDGVVSNARQSEKFSPKFVIIHGRFVISHSGIRHFHLPQNGAEMERFASDKLMAEMQRDDYPLPTTLAVAQRLLAKLTVEFRDFDAAVPRAGLLHPVDLSDSQQKVITRFDVVGWDGDGAHEFEVRVEMAWNSLSHQFPPIWPMYPGTRKFLSCYVHGQSGVIRDVLDSPESLSRKKLMEALPQETNALLLDRDLDLVHMGRLARELVVLQIERTPESVGYPVTIVSIPPGGRARQQSYIK